jgi:SSS family solute:Na+ symporter
MFAIVTFLVFTALVALVSWWKTRHDDVSQAKVYFLAGRNLPWFFIAGSLLLTNLSTEQLIGLNGSAYRHGFEVMAWEVVAAVTLVAMAWYFLPRYWRTGIYTVPQFLELRYDRGTRRWVSGVFLLTICVGFLPFVLYSGAVALEGLFDVSTRFGLSRSAAIVALVWAIGVVGSIYAIFGGLTAVAVSDSINGVGLLAGGLLIPLLGMWALGDGSLLAGWQRLVENQPQALAPLGDSDSVIPAGTLFTGLLLVNIYYWCMNQTIVQRVFGARTLAEGQKGVLMTGALKLLGPFYLVLPGIIALELFGSDLADGDLAYPLLVEAVLPTPLVGFFGAVLFGAILSSFNSALHSASTLFGLDLYQGLLRRHAGDAEAVSAGRLFGIALAIGAMVAAPMIAQAPGGLFLLMKKLAAIFNIPLLAIIIMGMVSRRPPAWAAKASIVLGAAFYICFSLIGGDRIFGWPVHWLHLAGINFGILCLFLAFVGWRWPAPKVASSPATAADVAAGNDDPPWRWNYAAGIGVIALVILFYAALQFLATRG